jgi:hypothetical protein
VALVVLAFHLPQAVSVAGAMKVSQVQPIPAAAVEVSTL